ncbi:MAG: helix-turn-helix domain-containing protein [Planctomycetaceae bacterium]|jgi:excisionase family DNA binding protein|nr:helix-turn-helix domain-containing protein [Planctomycetaceae bacterium]
MLDPKEYPEILTVDEAAEYLKVSPGMIRKLVNEERIAYFRIGSRIRILRDDLVKSLRCLSNTEKIFEKN